jgi:hypothetical protein
VPISVAVGMVFTVLSGVCLSYFIISHNGSAIS